MGNQCPACVCPTLQQQQPTTAPRQPTTPTAQPRATTQQQQTTAQQPKTATSTTAGMNATGRWDDIVGNRYFIVMDEGGSTITVNTFKNDDFLYAMEWTVVTRTEDQLVAFLELHQQRGTLTLNINGAGTFSIRDDMFKLQRVSENNNSEITGAQIWNASSPMSNNTIIIIVLILLALAGVIGYMAFYRTANNSQ